MIILDTNVVSEPMRPKPSERVRGWIETQVRAELCTTVITQAEILYGLALLPSGKRRQTLTRAVHEMFSVDFRDRVLPFDGATAEHFAAITADRRKAGMPIGILDAQIAAIARTHGARLATRDIADFQGCGIQLINPWSP